MGEKQDRTGHCNETPEVKGARKTYYVKLTSSGT